MKRNTVTYDCGGEDRGELERIYDRLRKKSWRRAWRTGRWFSHENYIHGLKDALNAVKEGRKK